MDEHGYPDEVELARIKAWPYTDLLGLMEFVRARWMYASDAENTGYFSARGRRYKLSTGGWSGNEDLWGALMGNLMFVALCWQSSRRGGHHIIQIPAPAREAHAAKVEGR